MEKYLVTIEFRYRRVEKLYGSSHASTTVTIGVYDTFDKACVEGNRALETLEERFPLHTFPGGNPAKRERFSENGGPFGTKNDLISDMAYLKTPFKFYAKISTLKCTDIGETLDDIEESQSEWKEQTEE